MAPTRELAIQIHEEARKVIIFCQLYLIISSSAILLVSLQKLYMVVKKLTINKGNFFIVKTPKILNFSK